MGDNGMLALPHRSETFCTRLHPDTELCRSPIALQLPIVKKKKKELDPIESSIPLAVNSCLPTPFYHFSVKQDFDGLLDSLAHPLPSPLRELKRRLFPTYGLDYGVDAYACRSAASGSAACQDLIYYMILPEVLTVGTGPNTWALCVYQQQSESMERNSFLFFLFWYFMILMLLSTSSPSLVLLTVS